MILEYYYKFESYGTCKQMIIYIYLHASVINHIQIKDLLQWSKHSINISSLHCHLQK